MTTGTVLAFDFGLQRIGVAVGELSHAIAHPLTAIAFADNARRMDAIAALVNEWRPIRFVVGMPSTDGTDVHPLRAPIDRFVRRLRARFGIETETIDESLSSWDASRTLSRSGVRARDQKQKLDSMAACAILTTWFEEHRPGATLPTANE